MWITALAFAYEVDSWTPRTVELADALPRANAHFQELLDQSIAAVECSGTEEQVRRELARSIRDTTAKRITLDDRTGLSRWGHGIYSGWLESDPEIPRITTGSEGMFAEVRRADGFILSTAGTAATVRLGDLLVGTDKIDHFLATGFAYFQWSREGRQPERAAFRGVRTEKTFLGQATSRAFSYGDLAANWDGFQFYAGLLHEGSVVQRDADGCPVRVRDWDWSEWSNTDWDEFVNPSVYGKKVARAVEVSVANDRQEICSTWAPTESRIPLPNRVPVAQGPFGLEGFCLVE